MREKRGRLRALCGIGITGERFYIGRYIVDVYSEGHLDVARHDNHAPANLCVFMSGAVTNHNRKARNNG
jgi:hypothetical protein